MKNIVPEDITHYHIFDTRFKPLSYYDLLSVAIEKEKTVNLIFEGAFTEDLSIPTSEYKQTQGNFTITLTKNFKFTV